MPPQLLPLHLLLKSLQHPPLTVLLALIIRRVGAARGELEVELRRLGAIGLETEAVGEEGEDVAFHVVEGDGGADLGPGEFVREGLLDRVDVVPAFVVAG